jgi:GalNAc-alpha-(1->4)-GalNAc-alpha-(1->3)-diNAcBac-PP-undecaprenol alpha-1,4-N-acetyl-D-galactosaminyltransferase
MKKSIAFVISSLDAGGAQRVVCTLANKLINSYNISIIVLYECSIFYELDPRIKVAFCKPIYIDKPKQSFISSLIGHYQLINRIKKNLKNHKIDIVIGFMTTANIYSVISAKWLKIPCIISERVHPKYSSINPFWIKLRKVFYPKASMIVVQTNEIKNYFSNFIDNDKLAIIKNPLDKKLSDSRLPTITKENIILNVGRLEYQKNQDLLIKAFANLNISDWTLILVGEGKKRQEYESLIETLGINEQVILVGNSNNVSAYYNKAKIFAFTSRFEGFPNALIEAMHFGLACVSTDCPSGPSDLISNNVNGILIPVEDQKSLELELNKLINSSSLIESFGKKAIQATETLDINTITNRWLDAINKFI